MLCGFKVGIKISQLFHTQKINLKTSKENTKKSRFVVKMAKWNKAIAVMLETDVSSVSLSSE